MFMRHLLVHFSKEFIINLKFFPAVTERKNTERKFQTQLPTEIIEVFSRDLKIAFLLFSPNGYNVISHSFENQNYKKN